MEFTRPGEPAFGQGIHSVPGDAMRLAAPDHGPSPEPDHPFAKAPEAVQVPRYRVVVEVALHHRLEPLPSLRNRIMRLFPRDGQPEGRYLEPTLFSA